MHPCKIANSLFSDGYSDPPIAMEEGTLPSPQDNNPQPHDDNPPLLVSYYVSMMKSLCVPSKD